jgi:Uma2 family endonuclease
MTQAYPIRKVFTPEEYLTLERQAETKSEFLCGEIYAMAGGKPNHNLIGANITGLCFLALRGTPCRVYSSDQKIHTPGGLFAYPDVTIGYNQPTYYDQNEDVLTNPQILIEVLSPSTANFDRTTKLRHYQQITSLTDCLLVYQDEPRIEHYARQSDNQWLQTIVIGLGAQVTLSSVNVTLALSEVYANVTFPQIAAQ